VTSGWSASATEIMLSAAYQLSGDYDDNNAKTDAAVCCGDEPASARRRVVA
jgi:hypothetical protein